MAPSAGPVTLAGALMFTLGLHRVWQRSSPQRPAEPEESTAASSGIGSTMVSPEPHRPLSCVDEACDPSECSLADINANLPMTAHWANASFRKANADWSSRAPGWVGLDWEQRWPQFPWWEEESYDLAWQTRLPLQLSSHPVASPQIALSPRGHDSSAWDDESEDLLQEELVTVLPFFLVADVLLIGFVGLCVRRSTSHSSLDSEEAKVSVACAFEKEEEAAKDEIAVERSIDLRNRDEGLQEKALEREGSSREKQDEVEAKQDGNQKVHTAMEQDPSRGCVSKREGDWEERALAQESADCCSETASEPTEEEVCEGSNEEEHIVPELEHEAECLQKQEDQCNKSEEEAVVGEQGLQEQRLMDERHEHEELHAEEQEEDQGGGEDVEGKQGVEEDQHIGDEEQCPIRVQCIYGQEEPKLEEQETKEDDQQEGLHMQKEEQQEDCQWRGGFLGKDGEGFDLKEQQEEDPREEEDKVTQEDFCLGGAQEEQLEEEEDEEKEEEEDAEPPCAEEQQREEEDEITQEEVPVVLACEQQDWSGREEDEQEEEWREEELGEEEQGHGEAQEDEEHEEGQREVKEHEEEQQEDEEKQDEDKQEKEQQHEKQGEEEQHEEQEGKEKEEQEGPHEKDEQQEKEEQQEDQRKKLDEEEQQDDKKQAEELEAFEQTPAIAMSLVEEGLREEDTLRTFLMEEEVMEEEMEEETRTRQLETHAQEFLRQEGENPGMMEELYEEEGENPGMMEEFYYEEEQKAARVNASEHDASVEESEEEDLDKSEREHKGGEDSDEALPACHQTCIDSKVELLETIRNEFACQIDEAKDSEQCAALLEVDVPACENAEVAQVNNKQGKGEETWQEEEEEEDNSSLSKPIVREQRPVQEVEAHEHRQHQQHESQKTTEEQEEVAHIVAGPSPLRAMSLRRTQLGFPEANKSELAKDLPQEPGQAACSPKLAVQRGAADLAEVLRRRRDVCQQWESAPDQTSADVVQHQASFKSELAARPRRALVCRNQEALEQLMQRKRDQCHVLEGKQEFVSTDAKAHAPGQHGEAGMEGQ